MGYIDCDDFATMVCLSIGNLFTGSRSYVLIEIICIMFHVKHLFHLTGSFLIEEPEPVRIP